MGWPDCSGITRTAVSLLPVSRSSGPVGAEQGRDVDLFGGLVDHDPLPVDHLEKEIADVHRVGVLGGVVELPQLGDPALGFSVTGSIHLRPVGRPMPLLSKVTVPS